MGDIKKQIIELIEPYMYKDLSEGVLYETTTGRICSLGDGNDIFIDIEPDGIYERWEDGRDKDKIIGHYDITAVMKYISSFYKGTVVLSDEGYLIEINRREFKYNFLFIDDKNIKIPIKPLHLYTEQEEKDLLDLLLINN